MRDGAGVGAKRSERKVAVIGAGPGGLSAARLLQDAGVRAVVYEASTRVGGKSLTVAHAGTLHEMGTCYSTLAHRLTNLWMGRLGMRRRRLGAQLVDGLPYLEWAREGPGEPLFVQGPRFIQLWFDFHRRLAHSESPEARAEAAAPIADWLDRHKLHRIRRFMLRAVTNLGYGFLHETPTVHALRWCTPALLVSGLVNEIRMPLQGWQPFWDRLATGLDVRLATPVTGIERDANGVTVLTPEGAERFNQIVVSIPPDDFGRIARPSPDEAHVAEAIDWGGYATTLCAADGWFTDHEIDCASASLEAGADRGSVLSARLSPTTDDGAPRLYVTGQYAGGLSDADLQRSLEQRLDAEGARLRGVVRREVWKYFPRYRPEAIRDGLIERMAALQGHRHTWWTGAAFSHEAVSNIAAHNVGLASAIRRRLLAI
jgi:predicted NAD/FAD-binding protein